MGAWAVIEDLHEPRLKVKDEKYWHDCNGVAILRVLGVKVGHTLVGNPRLED